MINIVVTVRNEKILIINIAIIIIIITAVERLLGDKNLSHKPPVQCTLPTPLWQNRRDVITINIIVTWLLHCACTCASLT